MSFRNIWTKIFKINWFLGLTIHMIFRFGKNKLQHFLTMLFHYISKIQEKNTTKGNNFSNVFKNETS